MPLRVEEIEDRTRFRQMIEINYSDLASFILDNIRKISAVTVFFWIICTVFLSAAVYFRIIIAGIFPYKVIFLHTFLGLIIFPLLSVPIHELMHVIPYFLAGARNIMIGMELRQFIFYVTAHRHVAGPFHFVIVALVPFVVISTSISVLVYMIQGPWTWSLTLFLFFHTTMCAGDFALLNFYWLNRDKKIFTWDDAERKIAYFYEELENKNT
jgi:hypothetical protein